MWVIVVADVVSKHIGTKEVGIGCISKRAIVVIHGCTISGLSKGGNVKVIALRVNIVIKSIYHNGCVYVRDVKIVVSYHRVIIGVNGNSNGGYVASYGVAIITDLVIEHINAYKVLVRGVGDSTVEVNGNSTVVGLVGNLCDSKGVSVGVLIVV